jgi:transposase
VPPEVAIPRPSPEELAKINDELNRLVDADNSDVKPLLEKFRPLLTIPAPRFNTAAAFTGGGVRAPRHAAFVERAKAGGIDLLFEGDSITDW